LRIDYNCQIGVSASIAKFYEEMFQVPVTKHANGHAIRTKFGQIISFNETMTGPPPDAYEVNPAAWGIHMCFYIEDFKENSNKLQRLFWVNPDYKIPPINDNVSTVEEALERKQFRIKHLGERFVFEHEIRAIDHPLSPIKQILHARL